jgi:hypothetical protein
VTLTELDGKLIARLRRTILRIVDRDGPVTRTHLGVQVRPHSEFWDIVLDDLVERGLITREPVIRSTGRAAVSYNLDHTVRESFGEGDFERMTPEEVSIWVDRQALPHDTLGDVQAATA